MKYALIGCGRISPNHVSAAYNSGLEIVGLCDLDLKKIKELKEKFEFLKEVKEYSDYKKMIEEQHPNLVAIATESGTHAKIACDAIKLNCNLIIEKPMALSLRDADKIISLSKEKNVKVCSCHQNRFNKSIQKIRQAVEQRKFGKMFYGTAHIRWNRQKKYYIQASWRGTWDQDGGVLMNQGIHNIDLLNWMLGGEIEEVFAYTDNLNHDYIEAEDLGLALIKYKNGVYGVVEGTSNVFPENLEETLYLFGENGTAKAGGSSVNNIEIWKFLNQSESEINVIEKYSEVHKNVYGLGHTPLYKDVVDAIINDREPYVNAYEGKKAIELVLAIYESSKTKKPVKMPLKNVATTDFIGRFFKKE